MEKDDNQIDVNGYLKKHDDDGKVIIVRKPENCRSEKLHFA